MASARTRCALLLCDSVTFLRLTELPSLLISEPPSIERTIWLYTLGRSSSLLALARRVPRELCRVTVTLSPSRTWFSVQVSVQASRLTCWCSWLSVSSNRVSTELRSSGVSPSRASSILTQLAAWARAGASSQQLSAIPDNFRQFQRIRLDNLGLPFTRALGSSRPARGRSCPRPWRWLLLPTLVWTRPGR